MQDPSPRRSPPRPRLAPLVAGLLTSLACGGEPPAAIAPVAPHAPEELKPDVGRLVAEHLARARSAPDSAEAHGTLAMVYEANALNREAAGSYGHAGRLDPAQTLWHLHRAISLERGGDFERALVELRELAEEDSPIPALHHRLGSWLLEVGEVARARIAFERARELAPESAAPWLGLASVELQSDRYAEALELAARGLQIEPWDLHAHYVLGLALRGLGRSEEAAMHLARGQGALQRFLPDDLTPRLRELVVNVQMLNVEITGLLQSGDARSAARLLERSLARNPDQVATVQNLAVAYIEMGEPQRALDLLERRAVFDDPAWSVTADVNRAGALLALDRTDDALAAIDRALARDGSLGRAHMVRARILARQGRHEEALGELAESARLDSSRPEVHLALAETCVLLGRVDEARGHLRTATARMPDSLQGFLRLASVCITLGELEEAEEALGTAQRMAPDHPRVEKLQRRLEEAGGS